MSVETRTTKTGKTRYLARVRFGEVLVASWTFGRKSDAEAWEQEQRHLLDTGGPLPPKRNFTVGELVGMWLLARKSGNPHTVDTDRNTLAALSKSLLTRPLASIQASDIRDHLIAELRDDKAASTVARSKTTLSEIPPPERVAAVLKNLRERRSDVADVFEFMSLTGVRWGEVRAIRVNWLGEVPLPQLNVERSHSDGYDEKDPKSWRGTRSIPVSPRAQSIFCAHAAGKSPDDYLFTNLYGGQLADGVVRKFPLGFRRHALRHYAASTWLRLGTPVHEVAEYLGDEARTVLTVCAHVLGEGQRRDFVQRLAAAERVVKKSGHSTDARPKIQPRSQPKKNRNAPGIGF